MWKVPAFLNMFTKYSTISRLSSQVVLCHSSMITALLCLLSVYNSGTPMNSKSILRYNCRGGGWADVGRGRLRRPFVPDAHESCQQRRATQASPPVPIIHPRPYSMDTIE